MYFDNLDWDKNITKTTRNITEGDEYPQLVPDNMDIYVRNSSGHNSFKNNSSATRTQYAQLGLVSIIFVKLY